jgi:hypothetical protein
MKIAKPESDSLTRSVEEAGIWRSWYGQDADVAYGWIVGWRGRYQQSLADGASLDDVARASELSWNGADVAEIN